MAASRRVIVIGAGVGGLVTALLSAASGLETLVVEQAAAPGGKLREIDAEGRPVDVGPTVFTMRGVFEEIFASAGAALEDHLTLKPAFRLARHAWGAGARLDLFGDVDANVDAIGDFAGAAEARGYRAFAARGARVYDTLRDSFIRASRPDPLTLTARLGLRRLPDLLAISPYTTLWHALGEHFRDPRLRQLFGRYATYCGSSPYLSPATLMLVAHVEREGVWTVEGGMQRLADALRTLAERLGAQFSFSTQVSQILVEGGRATGVVATTGERFEAGAVVFNGDVSALSAGLLGRGVRAAAPATAPESRSLSAVTWAGSAEVQGFDLIRHNVFFGPNYAEEFDAIFKHRRLPRSPTLYVCASDRLDEVPPLGGAERLFCLINAPSENGAPLSAEEVESCVQAATGMMEKCGLAINWRTQARTTPSDFARMFPATGGALYGPASHGWRASFQRSGTRTRLPRLYLAGGSVHPGPGVPMAALSGRQAALCLISDLASTNKFVPAATPGGMSMRSATTASSD